MSAKLQRVGGLLGALVALWSGVAAAAEVEQLHVLPFRARGGLTETKTKLVDELFLTELSKVAPAGLKITGHSDLVALIEHDRLRSALSCDDTTCLVEIGAALGASHIMVPTLGELAERLVLNVKVLHVGSAQVVYRQTLSCSNDEQALVETLELLAEEVAAALGWDEAVATPEAVETAPAPEPTPVAGTDPAPETTAPDPAPPLVQAPLDPGPGPTPEPEPKPAVVPAPAPKARPATAKQDAGSGRIPVGGILVGAVGAVGLIGSGVGSAFFYSQLASPDLAWADRDRSGWLTVVSLCGLGTSTAIALAGAIWTAIAWPGDDDGGGG